MPKLKRVIDYIQWKQRVKTYLYKEEYALVLLTDFPEKMSAKCYSSFGGEKRERHTDHYSHAC